MVARARDGLLLLGRLAQEELLILDDLVRAVPRRQALPVEQPVRLLVRPRGCRLLRRLRGVRRLWRVIPSMLRVHRGLMYTGGIAHWDCFASTIYYDVRRMC